MENLFDAVKRNEYGFYELKDEYRKKMQSFYENDYYQLDKALYSKVGYSEEELTYKQNLFREKEFIYTKICGGREPNESSFLDIGCGEGFAMSFFHRNGWTVCGVDFSNCGIRNHNPEMEKFLIKGDLIKTIKESSANYSFINMDNVLEHLPNPKDFLNNLKKICTEETIICVTVPNDFSITQKTLFKNGCIDNDFWVTRKTSEHFNYFTLENLTTFVKKNGFNVVWESADYPIDFNLFNPKTNYVKSPNLGHDGHLARLKIENMIFNQSLENTVRLHNAYARLGIGRNATIYIKLKMEN